MRFTPFAISFLVNFIFFPNVSLSQDEPLCYLINSSDDFINLEQMCQDREPRVSLCQGPFDSDGFPVALSRGVSQLRAAIRRAEQRDIDPQIDPEVQNVIGNLIDRMPFGKTYKDLRDAIQLISNPSQFASSTQTTLQIEGQIQSLSQALYSDECFNSFLDALAANGVMQILF